jgi:PAS domain S-box-containing protein
LSSVDLSQFLRSARQRIFDRFVRDLARREPKAEGLAAPLLLDHLPAIFDQVLFELGVATGTLPEHQLPAARAHARERWHAGFDVRAVVREYGVLRHAILAELTAQGVSPSPKELEPLLNCLNEGIAESVEAFAEESDSVRTTLDQRELALAANQSKLNLVTEAIPQIVWTTGPDGQTDWINGRWREYTGLEPSECVGVDWLASYHPDDQAITLERWRHCVRAEEPFEIEYRLRRHDGAYRWFLGRGIPIRDENGRIARWFGTCTDIDDQKQTQARLLAATEESSRLNRLKDEFLATVSHELRTPLQSILGWARMLKTGQLPQERALAALDTIERNAKAQAQLIEDILDISRIITGKVRINTQSVELTELLNSALDTAQPAARAKGITLNSEVPSDLGLLLGDADRLQQVVWNLLSNAVKFTPAGGTISLEALRDQSNVRIRVTDDGQGIDPNFLPYVFDRFRQADAGPTRAHGGLGIGLAIVRHIVEMHGGVVEVLSAGLGHGATFTVSLPVKCAINTPLPPESAPLTPVPIHVEPDALSGLSVLVVDDQPDARELVVAILVQHGATALGVGSVREALAHLAQSRVDALVSDIAMPQEDGHSLIRKLRATPELEALPALALTAYAHERDKQRALEAGYHLHLAKPVEPVRLVQAVARLVGPRSS